MFDLILFAMFPGARMLLYAFPLIVVVSLVYGATRHELWPAILKHAWDTAVWILGFMGVVFVVILLAGWSL
ncbi:MULTISPECIES: hypothetical protein [Pirellulaceae]|uniref:Uncharacterized protein n=1 Tax=Bremerella volcania TaxID=2527984 RepID=A0A518CF31_9BACT|nr:MULTISPECIES: hypothetical protein [Pirellulaceae]QDU77838.1 hypothetical protein Pan97_49170 [Bremerella volcania]